MSQSGAQSEAKNDATASLLGAKARMWKLQVATVGFVQFCENLSLLIIFPFLPFMVQSFYPHLAKRELGYYTGVVGSAFFAGNAMFNLMWGRLADRIGRKPVMISGMCGLILSVVVFGFSTSFEMAVAVRLVWGAINGNIGVTKTVLAEICDESNSARGFAILGLYDGIGRLVGPVLGGLLAMPATQHPGTFLGRVALFRQYPFALPCLVAATFSITGLLLVIFLLDETLPRHVIERHKKRSRRRRRRRRHRRSKHRHQPRDKSFRHSSRSAAQQQQYYTHPAGMSESPLLSPVDGSDRSRQFSSTGPVLPMRNGYDSDYSATSSVTSASSAMVSEEEFASVQRYASVTVEEPLFLGLASVDINRELDSWLHAPSPSSAPSPRMALLNEDQPPRTPPLPQRQPDQQEQKEQSLLPSSPRVATIRLDGSEHAVTDHDPDNHDHDLDKSAAMSSWHVLGNPNVRLSIACYALFGFMVLIQTEIYPLWAVLSPAHDGFGFSSSEIGISMSVVGPTQLMYTLMVYPRLAVRFGCRTLLTVGLLVYAVALALFPLVQMTVAHGSHDALMWGTLMLFLIVLATCSNTCFTCVFILIANSCTASVRATVNGLAQSFVALGRTIGPTAGSSLFAWSLGNQQGWPLNFWFVWLVLAVTALFTSSLAMRIDPELPPYDPDHHNTDDEANR